ncbi:hypothetical protein WME91_52095 [Sorangium sp. So ce269]
MELRGKRRIATVRHRRTIPPETPVDDERSLETVAILMASACFAAEGGSGFCPMGVCYARQPTTRLIASRSEGGRGWYTAERSSTFSPAPLNASASGEAGYAAVVAEAGAVLPAAHPTAVNLAWAVGRALALAREHAALAGEERAAALASYARGLHREDVEACRVMGWFGPVRLLAERTVLTLAGR